MSPLLALCIVCGIDVLGFGIVIPLLPYMGRHFGASPAMITPIIGSYSLCQLLAAPVWGRLSDRFGRRPILLTSMLGSCASYLILAFAPGLGWLLVSRILAGLMAGNIAAALAYASDISLPAARAKTLGSVGAAIGIGFMLGPAIGGALAGEKLQTASFLRPALASCALSLVAMLLVLLVLPESHTAERRGVQRASGVAFTRWRVLRARPALGWLALAALCVTFSQSTLESILQIWAMDRYRLGPRNGGLLLFGLAIVAVTMQGGFVRVLAPRLGEHRLALGGIFSWVLGLLSVAFIGSVAGAVVGLMLCGLGQGAFNPSGSALASHEANEHNRGIVMGTYQGSNSLARVIGPLVSGPVYMIYGASAPFALAALVTLQALWCIAAARRATASIAQAPGGEAV